jgi:hypothetical protein
VEVDFDACPASSGVEAGCAVLPPNFNISQAVAVYPNGQLSIFNETGVPDLSKIINDNISAPLSNLIQSFHASVRVDLGNPSRNNFLTSPAAVNTTLFATFPATEPLQPSNSNLYLSASQPNKYLKPFFPVLLEGPARVQVVYLCRFQRRKPLGQAFISVLVATLSMFSSGWAIFMFIATNVIKSRDEKGEIEIICGYKDHE